MAELAVRVDIAAPPEAVWAAVVDWDSQHEWMWLTRVRGIDGGGHGVGARLEAFTGVGPLGFVDPMVVTEWDPPRRCTVRHTGGVVRGTATFAVEPRIDGTSTFEWVEWVEPPFGRFGLVVFPLVRPVLLVPLRRSLARLKARIEA